MRRILFLALVSTAAASVSLAQDPAAQDPGARVVSPETAPIGELIAEAERMVEGENWQRAAQLVQAILAREPENLEALTLQGEVAWNLQDADRARDSWLEVLGRQKNDFRANFGMGRAWLRPSTARQAVGYLEKAVPVAPPDKRGETLTMLARAYRLAGMGSRSRETVMQAIDADPDSLEALEIIVEIDADATRYDEALVNARRMVEIARGEVEQAPADTLTLRRLYAAYDVNLRVLRTQAQSLYEVNPDRSVSDRLRDGSATKAAAIINDVVDLLLLQGELEMRLRDFDILAQAEKAVEYVPTNPLYHYKVGMLAMRTYQFQHAADSFMKVVELDPANSDARRQAAIVLQGLLESNPSNIRAREQLDKLRQLAPPAPPAPGDG